MREPSIILLIPYFGKWPAWFDCFLLTCRYNASIQWLFFTDCPVPENTPDNVVFQSISFEEYKNKVSAKLGINFDPVNPYKLCDLKPALGFIHEEEISGYEFFGFSDIDLIYGDLRQYFTAERLSKFDLYSTHARRVSGHFCLMRNTKKMREAFKLMKNWQVLLSEQTHHALDEGAFSRIFIRHKNFPKWLFDIFAYFNSWRRRSEFIEAHTTPNAGVKWIDNSYDFPSEWYWQDGVLTNSLTKYPNYPYFHFYGWKKNAWNINVTFQKLKSGCSSFCVSENGIKMIEESK